MEQGLYFPVYSAYSQGRDGTLNDSKYGNYSEASRRRAKLFSTASIRVQRELPLLGSRYHVGAPPDHWPASQAVGHHREPDRRYNYTGVRGLEFVPQRDSPTT